MVMSARSFIPARKSTMCYINTWMSTLSINWHSQLELLPSVSSGTDIWVVISDDDFFRIAPEEQIDMYDAPLYCWDIYLSHQMLHSTILFWPARIVHPKSSTSIIVLMNDQPLGESIELGGDTVGFGVDVPAAGRSIRQTLGWIKFKLFSQIYNMLVWVLSF